jgi:ribosomal protein S18 acetylase RimI-like enzyme
MIEAHLHYRVAAPGDSEGIFDVLAEVAPEIPLLIDTRERRKAVSEIINECISTGESWVTTAGDEVVVGFCLAKPDEMERFHHGNHALHLTYSGVSNSYRQQGIFRALIQQIKDRGTPLTAIVKAGNQCQMAARLQRMGFEMPAEHPQTEVHLKWQPNVEKSN